VLIKINAVIGIEQLGNNVVAAAPSHDWSRLPRCDVSAGENRGCRTTEPEFF
jgi:hypothetical protein